MFPDDNQQKLKAVLIAVALLAALWVQAPRLSDPFRLDEDFRLLYWTNKFHEQGLFPTAERLGQTYVELHFPWGSAPLDLASPAYSLLLYAGSFIVAPRVFVDWLPFLLIAMTVWYLFEYGMAIGGRREATILAVGFSLLNLSSPTSLTVVSGLQRGFACSLMIALLYYLRRRDPWGTAATILVSALIYPPAFLLAAATSALSFLTLAIASPQNRKLARKCLSALAVALCIGVLVLSPAVFPRILEALGVDSANDYPDMGTRAYRQVLSNPRYKPGGRKSLFSVFPVIGRAGLVTKSLTALHLVVLASVGGLIYLVLGGSRPLRLPRETWCLLLGSLGLFAAAWAAAFLTNSFLLYLPSRYTRVGLYLFFAMFALLNISDATQEAVQLPPRHPKAMLCLVAGVEVVAVGYLLFWPTSGTVFMGISLKWLMALACLLLGILAALAYVRKALDCPSHLPWT